MDRWSTRFALFLVCGGAIVVRVVGVTHRSLWFDEAFSWRIASFPGSEMVQRVAADNHPPLHSLLLKSWIAVFGDSVAALRGMSVFFSVLTILAAYLFVAEAFRRGDGETSGQRAGLLAAGLLAVSVFHIHWSSVARTYSMGTAFVALSSWAMFRAVHRQRKRDWALYTVFALAAAYSHYYCLFSIAAQFLFLAGWRIAVHWRSPAKIVRDHIVRATLVCGALVALGFAPWLPTLLAQRAQVQKAFWAREVELKRMTFVFYEMFVEPEDAEYNETYGLTAVALTAGVLLSLLCRPEPGDWYLFLAATAPFAISIVISKFDTKIFHLRYFLFANLFILAALARAVSRIRWTFPRIAIALWLIGNMVMVDVWFAMKMDYAHRPGARAAAEFIDEHRRDGEPVIVSTPLYYFPFLYHCANKQGLYCYDEGADGIVHYEGGAAIVEGELVTDDDLRKLKPGRVWIVNTRGGRWGFRYVPLRFKGRLLRSATFREAFGVQGTLVVREYEVQR